MNSEFSLDGVARAAVYKESVIKLILGLKRDRSELLGQVAMVARPAFRAANFFDEIEMLVPVPLHWRRCIRRGYNQAEILTKLLKHPSAKISYDLARVRNTRMQPSLDFNQRFANVKNAFAVRKGHVFDGKCICLVDDVMTTGATLNECARVLKQAGAKAVYSFVIAVAGQKIDT
jgi:ComF family protein